MKSAPSPYLGPIIGFVSVFALPLVANAQAWPTVDPRFVPSGAVGGPAEKFGVKGQVAVYGDFGLGLGFTSVTQPKSLGGASASTSVITVAPSIDVFFAKNLAIGGMFKVQHTSIESSKNTELRLTPTVGYNLLLSRRVTWFPKLGPAFGYQKGSGGMVESTSWRLAVDVAAPLLFHPTLNFFVGFGPHFSRDLISKVQNPATKKDVDAAITTEFALSLVIGGYF